MSSLIYNAELMQHYHQPSGWVDELTLGQRHNIENSHCGDELKIGTLIESNHLLDIEFCGECCAVCRASSSILYQNLFNQPINDALSKIMAVEKWLLDEGERPNFMGPLAILEKNYIRRQCAQLPWEGIRNSIINQMKLAPVENKTGEVTECRNYTELCVLAH
ncbi:MAG: iron-sulfur cluster assembly scaffold protein [Gammaproteobacteria bacterium]|nr:iron-sulfur cluster assembly scaffold protein [Gammaproteobacteria bacterium]